MLTVGMEDPILSLLHPHPSFGPHSHTLQCLSPFFSRSSVPLNCRRACTSHVCPNNCQPHQDLSQKQFHAACHCLSSFLHTRMLLCCRLVVWLVWFWRQGFWLSWNSRSASNSGIHATSSWRPLAHALVTLSALHERRRARGPGRRQARRESRTAHVQSTWLWRRGSRSFSARVLRAPGGGAGPSSAQAQARGRGDGWGGFFRKVREASGKSAARWAGPPLYKAGAGGGAPVASVSRCG